MYYTFFLLNFTAVHPINSSKLFVQALVLPDDESKIFFPSTRDFLRAENGKPKFSQVVLKLPKHLYCSFPSALKICIKT